MGNIRLWNKDREVLSEIFTLCDTLADLESVKEIEKYLHNNRGKITKNAKDFLEIEEGGREHE